MFSYYLELVTRPYYELSYGERMYVDAFPLIVLLVIACITCIIAFLVDIFKKKK